MTKQIDDNIWTMDGPDIVFAGAAMHTRMTIVRLSNGSLWIHSPIQLEDHVVEFIRSLKGQVAALIAPNKFHYMFVDAWRSAYPNAAVFAEEHLQQKISSLVDTELLSNQTPSLYATDIDQVVLTGNRFFQEVAFFHKASGSLILTDLMINLKTDRIRWLPRLFLAFEGVTYPNGGIPRLYRWFSRNKQNARSELQVITAWQPRRILFCHGEPFQLPAEQVLKREFAYLQ